MRPALSSTHASNELMRRCLVRWQSERQFPARRPLWRPLPAFSFNPRFLRVLASDYSQRRYGYGVRNFSDVPGKPGWQQKYITGNTEMGEGKSRHEEGKSDDKGVPLSSSRWLATVPLITVGPSVVNRAINYSISARSCTG